jgi:hypothetical protein
LFIPFLFALGRLGGLLSQPLAHASEAAHIFRGEVAAVQESTHAERIARLRTLEQQIDQDDWMYT